MIRNLRRTTCVVVVSPTSAIFDQAAINTVMKYQYKPRVEDGQAIEVTGVKEKVTFRMAIGRPGGK